MAIDINLKHVYDEATGMDSGGGSSQYMSDVLSKLDASINKLNSTIASLNRNSSSKGSSSGGDGGGNRESSQHSSLLRSIGTKIGTHIGTAVAASIGISALRLLNNQTQAIMSRANTAGGFAAQAILGNANNSFGSYASSYVGIEAQRLMANNNAISEGATGLAGAAVGTLLGAGAVLGTDGTFGVSGIGKAGLAGAAAGVGVGEYYTAKNKNQYIQQLALIQAARVQLEADASVSQWKTGFSRFGMNMTRAKLIDGSLTGGSDITAPLQREFFNRYSGSMHNGRFIANQNFKGIQEGIVPYLTSNPMSKQNGDLNNVAQKFLKAGFAVSDFSRLTTQAGQYTAITGKHLEEFSTQLVRARAKFGDSYTAGTNQVSLGLMGLGYSQAQAQHLAFQSQFNGGMMNNMGQWANQNVGDYYKNRALSASVGFDINKSLMLGHITGASAGSRGELNKELAAYRNNGNLGPKLMMLLGSGTTNYSGLRSLLQGQVGEGSLGVSLTAAEKRGLSPAQQKALLAKKQKAFDMSMSNPGLAPGQSAAESAGTMGNLLANVNTMNVNASVVNLINGPNGKNLSYTSEASNAYKAVKNYLVHDYLGINAPMATGATHFTPTKH